MWIILFGLLVGLSLGFYAELAIPLMYAKYLSIAIVAALDSAFGGLRSSLEGTFQSSIFISGFFTNALLAAGFTYIGERLGADLQMAALIALGIRIFTNLGFIRRELFEQWGWVRK